MQWMASAGARWDERLARLADRLGDQPQEFDEDNGRSL
jgi:hypothetical protein